MKKELGIVVLLSVFLLSGCGSDKQEPVTQNSSEPASQQVTSQSEENSSGALIEATKDEKVKLYANKEMDKVIEGVTLDVNGSKKDFDWKIPDSGTKPQLFYTDLTSDGKEEAVVIIQTGKGTGLDNFEIHVINADDLSEIKVQSYEDIVANHIESHVAKKDDGIAVTVITQGKELKFENKSAIAAPDQKELAFGGVVTYTLENQTIKLNIPGSVGVSPIFVCDFNVSYKYDSAKNEFIVDQIEAKPIKE
ncbi:hypothetical protein ACFVQB_27865 [Paenibacillus sp. NPDC057886]|uniref:hypothetical protein n=1 Tax=Paenibacillus sp. NPDC057886 TaxID=3346270 RepID=UPI003688DA4E